MNMRIKLIGIWGIILTIILLIAFGYWIGDKRDSANVENNSQTVTGDVPPGYYPFWFAMRDEPAVSFMSRPGGITFGDNVGRIFWDKGIMIFEGNVEKSAEIFFEGYLKPLIDEYIVSEMEKEEVIELILEEPEEIMYQFYTDFDEFQPIWFLEVVKTDMSKCFIDGRLRLNLNGKIYWIRLEED